MNQLLSIIILMLLFSLNRSIKVIFKQFLNQIHNPWMLQLSGDGETAVVFSQIGSNSAQIFVIKRIILTYHQIKIQNFTAYIPSQLTQMHEDDDRFYNRGHYQYYRPFLNHDGSMLFFIEKNSCRVTGLEITKIGVQNYQPAGKFYGSQNESQNCSQINKQFFTVEMFGEDEYLSILQRSNKKLIILKNRSQAIFNQTLNISNSSEYFGAKIVSDKEQIIFSKASDPHFCKINTNTLNNSYNCSPTNILNCYFNQSLTSPYNQSNQSLCKDIGQSLRHNSYYIRNLTNYQNRDGFLDQHFQIKLIDKDGRIRGERFANYVEQVQPSKNKRALAYSFINSYQYKGYYILEMVIFGNNLEKVKAPNMKIVESSPIKYLALNQNGSRILYYLKQTKEIVLIENQESNNEMYPCINPFFFGEYPNKCIDTVAVALSALIFSLLLITLLISLFCYCWNRYRKHKNRKNKEAEKNQKQNSHQAQTVKHQNTIITNQITLEQIMS